MRYATWKLSLDSNLNTLTGPEQTILDQGFLVKPLCSIGEVSNHDILGEFTDNNEDLSTWTFNEISKDTAIAIYSDNFTEIPAEPESRRPAFTLDMALQYIFSNN